MKPESIETYRALKQQVKQAKETLKEVREVSPPEQVENLSPTERIERLTGLIKHMVTSPRETRSMFGANISYFGTTPPRIVLTPSGEEYKVHFTVHSGRKGFRQPEHISIEANWDKCVTQSKDIYNYNEYMTNGWEDSNPTLPRGLMLLANLEWSLEAYLDGTPVEE